MSGKTAKVIVGVGAVEVAGDHGEAHADVKQGTALDGEWKPARLGERGAGAPTPVGGATGSGPRDGARTAGVCPAHGP